MIKCEDIVAQLSGRSVSRRVREQLAEGLSAGRVLAIHGRACNLAFGQGSVIAVVAPEVGDGPLNVVLENWARPLDDVQAGLCVTCGPERLEFSDFEIDLGAADTWEPCPDWVGLRARRTVIKSSLPSLAVLCLEHDPGNALLPLLGAPFPVQGLAAMLAERFCEGAGKLVAGWYGDENALAEGGAGLAGLGEGLTPAGDDFLLGLMLWAWLAHPAPRQFCSTLFDAAALRTTILSAAFLRAAARGQCSADWHRLLAVLAEGRSVEIAGAARAVLAHGASSGLDALIGFLYLSQDKEDTCRTSI